MKIKLEPERLKKLLEAGMIYKTKPLIDPTIIKFDDKGAVISDIYSDVVGVHIKMSKKFFLGHESEEEVVAVPSIVLDRLGWGFNDAEIEVFTKDNKVFLKGGHDSFDTDLEDLEPKVFPFPLKESEHGTIPEKLKVESAIKLDAKELNLPIGKEYHFELKEKKLSVKIPDGGNFVRKFEGKIIGDKDVKLSLDGEYFNHIVNNLEGEVTFILNPDLVAFAEKRKDYTKTFILSTQVLEE